MAKDTRKGHGEGTIYLGNDGYWRGQITIAKNDEGKQQRKTFSAKTQKEIIAKMKDFQHKQERGELPKSDSSRLGDWVSLWLETYKKPTLRQTTYENYATMVRVHIVNHPIGNLQVQKITTDQIQKYMKVKSERGKIIIEKEEVIIEGLKVLKETSKELPLSNRTVNLLHFLIRSALEQAKKNNVVSHNVADNCSPYKHEKKEINPLTNEQAKTLMDVVKDHRLYASIVLDLYSGIRRGELLALRWENVDTVEGTITIIENLVRVKGGTKIHKPKTKSSIRTIQLPDKVKEVLLKHKEQQEIEKHVIKELHEEGKVSEPYQDEDLVFCQKNGKRIQPRGFQRMFDGWALKAGLPKETRFHDLRHTFTTNMINAGVDIKTTQSFTGHADTRTLLDTYSHIITSSQKLASKTMNDLIPEL